MHVSKSLKIKLPATAFAVAWTLCMSACRPAADDEKVPPQRKSVQAAAKGLGLTDSDAVRLPLPPRPRGAMTGHEFLMETATVGAERREQMIEREILNGNVPTFLRGMKPVNFKGIDGHGAALVVIVWVMPDYLAIGDDDDFIRIPMNLYTATRVARQLGLGLPTPRIVKTIADQASRHLMPIPLTPGPAMSSNAYIALHNRMINDAIGAHHYGELMAGQKKDLVISVKSLTNPGRVVIYGWHQPNGKAIQQLSTVHDGTYADYSHGVRLVSRFITVNGRSMLLDAALADPNLAPLLSSEGRMDMYASLMNPTRRNDPEVHATAALPAH